MDIPTFEDLLRPIKTQLWVAGLTYGQRKIYMRFYVLFTLFSIVIFQEFGYLILYSSFDNFLKITQLLPCICACITTDAKVAALLVKYKEVNDLTNNLQDMYKNILEDDEKRNIVRNEMIYLKKLLKVWAIFNQLEICVYSLSSPFLMLYTYVAKNEVVFDLPFPLAVPFATDQWFPWLLEYMHVVITVIFCLSLIILLDSVYFILCTHVYINFTVLCESFKKMNGTESTETLKETIRSHQHIIRLSELLNDIFRVPNLLTFVMGTFQICFLGFTVKMGSWSEIPKSAFLLATVLLQLFIISHFGENILSESRRVGDAAYECDWYNMDTKARKMIQLVILRSQKPQQLTSFNFNQMSYASFGSIVTKAWSYFTILQTVYKPPETSG